MGRIVDRAHPTPVIGFGFSAMAIGLTWLALEMTPTTPIWRLLLPQLVMGIGMAFIWSPLAATAMRNLPPDLAGAGSGVYNATRQVGSVLGSAGIAAYMTSRIGAEMPGRQARRPAAGVPCPRCRSSCTPFAAAMSQSMFLPAFIALFGVVAALFLLGFGAEPTSASNPSPTRPRDDDDDDYVEFIVSHDRAERDADDAVTDSFRSPRWPSTPKVGEHLRRVHGRARWNNTAGLR